MTDAQNRLDELATLGAGWLDGDGEAIEEEPLTLARELVTAIGGDPHIYPTPEGGVQVIYRNGDCYVEFELSPDGNHETWIGLDD